MIFGAITGLLASVGYSVANRIYLSYKIGSYRPPIDTSRKVYNRRDADKLIALFYSNWCNDGATLYPQKLITLLASDENLRRLWVQRAVEIILDGEDPCENRMAECYADKELIEYDFVAAFHPDDFAKLVEYTGK